MSFEALRKLQKLSLFFLILFLPLNAIPSRFSMPGLGSNLSNYFFVFSMALLVYEYVKYSFKIDCKAKKFFVTYIIWQIICLMNGLLNYEFNELLTVEQIPKLEFVLNVLGDYGIKIEDLLAVKIWLLIKISKDLILLNNDVFLMCFYIYHLYGCEFKRAFSFVRTAIINLFIIMGSYSLIELLWLKFNLINAKCFLEQINPYLYDIEIAHGWWPPLLWVNQLRSICREPSFFGIISVLCLPILWSLYLEKKYKKISLMVIFYFTFMIAATNARTAIVLAVGELLLLILFNVIIRSRDYFKKSFLIMLLSVMAFTFNLMNFNDALSNNTIISNSAESYIKSNLTSVADTTSRSNNARFANLIGNVNTIIEYPVMGTGTGLKDAYICKNLPNFAYENPEVRNWILYIHNDGVLKSGGFPSLNKYADVAVQNGVIGLMLYFSVVAYLIFNLVKNWAIIKNDYKAILLIIAMLGLLAAGMSNTGFVICNGIVWGLLYCKLEEINKLEN